jgi:hypothetical protein
MLFIYPLQTLDLLVQFSKFKNQPPREKLTTFPVFLLLKGCVAPLGAALLSKRSSLSSKDPSDLVSFAVSICFVVRKPPVFNA